MLDAHRPDESLHEWITREDYLCLSHAVRRTHLIGETQTNTRRGRIGGEQVIGARKEEEVEDYFYVELRLQPVEIPYA